ncbi:MAG: TRAP-type C4-dicarboxylate transport system, small permease component [Candidatus Accumulibacter regalis]|jgi:TRAP-type C4-dicarboxylate transport system permease small subunit|uniref:TRAP transporter small permease protein n=1 Tax=Accumulibacter regalis TaxID=522306 RepID=A0A011QIE2_ACCRE|nr:MULTISPECIES: TRAP transporter small permease subunit [unclassified Candidatus Accumulibacter]EXI89097.1 MAG: TRAP-type C4-dicarboxylate transport system, small permease component [Candidatus Accumulibacter regalis]MQM35260.1 C4-dicarboxylate ABC transporter permease [Candidatus Accumulibacter phosphatis]MBL8367091.1 TRAP transporter small permease subunit [Accumulibacter sp.]MBN8515862.1 TRAP transporter small permease subunit [Accumulibacter sp.]MBO3702998.1 TRAP transporter small permeas
MIKLFLAAERRVSSAMMVLACLLMALAATLGFYQVITRFVFSEPSTWSEVGVRMTLIWMVMLGTVAAFRQGALVSVDLMFRLSQGSWRRILHILITTVIIAFLAVIVWFGAEITWRVRHQELAGLEMISIAWGYLALPVGAFFSIVAVLANHFDPRHMELDTAL